MREFVIEGHTEVSAAATARAALLDWLDATGAAGGGRLEIDTQMPTQVALQLLLAALRSGADRGVAITTGPNASALRALSAFETTE